jgi:hypothetical protein
MRPRGLCLCVKAFEPPSLSLSLSLSLSAHALPPLSPPRVQMFAGGVAFSSYVAAGSGLRMMLLVSSLYLWHVGPLQVTSPPALFLLSRAAASAAHREKGPVERLGRTLEREDGEKERT